MIVEWDGKEVELECTLKEARKIGDDLYRIVRWGDITDKADGIAALAIFLTECQKPMRKINAKGKHRRKS